MRPPPPEQVVLFERLSAWAVVPQAAVKPERLPSSNQRISRPSPPGLK
jgi:hypothetical protein